MRCDRRRAAACVVVVELAIRVRREVVVVLAKEIKELAFEVDFVEELVEDGLDAGEHGHPRVRKSTEPKRSEFISEIHGRFPARPGGDQCRVD